MTEKEINQKAAHIPLYDELIAAFPGLERKGKAMPYTSCNGHMFSFLSENGTLAIRLPEKERNLFLQKYQSGLMEAHGTIMKEYVAIPALLLENIEELKGYMQASYEYIKTLKPKPTKRSKP